MSKRIPIIVVSILFALVFMAKTEFGIDYSEKLLPGAIHFKAKRNNDRYLLAFHLGPVQENYKVKAIKVTFEPSGTVALAVFEEKCSEMERRDFLLGKTPLSTIESSEIGEIAPLISLDYPTQIEKDNLIKIEYLIEKDGSNSTILAASSFFENSGEIDFSITPEGKFFKFCCYCCNPPCCVNCEVPIGTCCCSCDTKVANCDMIKCPPPPC